MNEYRERAALLKEGFTKMGLSVYGLDHTSFAWVEIPSDTTSEGLADRILEEASVLVIPGNAFGAAGEGFFRASIFADKERIEEAIARIESEK